MNLKFLKGDSGEILFFAFILGLLSFFVVGFLCDAIVMLYFDDLIFAKTKQAIIKISCFAWITTFITSTIFLFKKND